MSSISPIPSHLNYNRKICIQPCAECHQIKIRFVLNPEQYLIRHIPLIVFAYFDRHSLKRMEWLECFWFSFKFWERTFDAPSIFQSWPLKPGCSSPQLSILRIANSYSSSVNGFLACDRLPYLLTSFLFTIMIKLFTTTDLVGFPTGGFASTFQDINLFGIK